MNGERKEGREVRAESSAKAVAQAESQWDLLSVLQIGLDVNVLSHFYNHLAAEILWQLPYIKSHLPPLPIFPAPRTFCALEGV